MSSSVSAALFSFFFSSTSVFSLLNVFLNVLSAAAVFSSPDTVFVALCLEVFLICVMT